MRVAAILLALTALPIAPAAFSMQTAPGHPTQHDELVLQKSVADGLTKCTLGRARSSAIAMVLYGPASAEAHRSRGLLEQALRGCMSARDRSITINAQDLTGNFAELLLGEGNGALLARAEAMTPVATVRLDRLGDRPNQAVLACAVAAQPKDAASLLRNASQSIGESSAFRATLPSIQACVPASYEMHLKPYQIRQLIAITLYRHVADRSEG